MSPVIINIRWNGSKLRTRLAERLSACFSDFLCLSMMGNIHCYVDDSKGYGCMSRRLWQVKQSSLLVKSTRPCVMCLEYSEWLKCSRELFNVTSPAASHARLMCVMPFIPTYFAYNLGSFKHFFKSGIVGVIGGKIYDRHLLPTHGLCFV